MLGTTRKEGGERLDYGPVLADEADKVETEFKIN
jgi:hypothetical protein